MEASEADSIIVRFRHLRENLEELSKKFGQLEINAKAAGQIQQRDVDTVRDNIRASQQAMTGLWESVHEPIRKASASLKKKEESAQEIKLVTIKAADSSTASKEPLPDTGKAIESEEIHVSKDSSQPTTSGVKEEEINLRPMTGTSKVNTNDKFIDTVWQDYQAKWEQLVSKQGINPSRTMVETSGRYNRVWMLEGSDSKEVRKWYDFGAIASIHTTAPGFPEIEKLPGWITEAVRESWQNNPHLGRGDILELKFISAAPEIVGKGSYPVFHFIKLQRPDMNALNRVKSNEEKIPLVTAISEDEISTRRAWGFWVCLTEMDKVKYPFKIFTNSLNGSFLVNSLTGKSTEFAETLFEKKRLLIWENKLPATEVTRRKACNMMHVGQWQNHICQYCTVQEKPLFGTRIRVMQKKAEPEPDKGKKRPKNFYKLK